MDLVEQYLISEKDKGYRVARNPNDGSWYVIGHVGGKHWMPVSTGFKSKKEAEKKLMHQLKADSAAKKELKTWDMMSDAKNKPRKSKCCGAKVVFNNATGDYVCSTCRNPA